MVNDILAHPDEHLYQIHSKNLEKIHIKINQSISILSVLSDWVSESRACTLSLEQQGTVDDCLFALIGLLKSAIKSLPKV